MRRILPLVIIGAVLLGAITSGWYFLRLKQQQQPSPTAPIPTVEEATETPSATATPSETPAPSETPSPSEPSRAAEAEATPAPGATTTPESKPVAKPELHTTPEPLHVRGNPKAKVTLEEYGDFQCAPCGRFYPVLRLMEQDYGDRLRVVFRHMPLKNHEHAPLAARAAEAAGLQGRFWEMHDLLFENSPRWTKGVETVGPDAPPSKRLESKLLAMDIEVRDVFAHYAELLHLDVDQFKQDLDSDQVKARVESDHSRGVKLGIDRTPTIYINGNHIGGTAFLGPDGLKEALEAAFAGRVYVPPPTATPGTSPTPK
jgi:protein-disulfide isomerase